MWIDRADSSFGNALARTGERNASALEDAVTGLFDLWRVPVLGYVVALGLPVAEGEEVIQEVFLSLFEHLRQGKSRANLRAWIFRVAHNLALKRRYATGRQLQQPIEAGNWNEVQDESPNPEQALAIKQRQKLLLAVVAALPEQDRCCLHLRAEGLRYREIAEVMGIALGTVALSLGRSLDRLRRVDR